MSVFLLICLKLDAIDFSVLSVNPLFLHLSNVFIILFLVVIFEGSSSSLVLKRVSLALGIFAGQGYQPGALAIRGSNPRDPIYNTRGPIRMVTFFF